MMPDRSSFSIRSATAGRESPIWSAICEAGVRPSFSNSARIPRSRSSSSTAMWASYYSFRRQSSRITVESSANQLQHRRYSREGERAGLGGSRGPARQQPRDARGSRILKLGAALRAAKQVALQVFDLHFARRIVDEAAQRSAAQHDRAKLEVIGTDGIPDDVALLGADAHEAVAGKNVHNLFGDSQLVDGSGGHFIPPLWSRRYRRQEPSEVSSRAVNTT